MKKTFKSAIITLTAILLLTTCQSTSSPLSEPIVSLHSVNLANVNFNGAQILCRLQVENPNPFEIPLPEVGWEFFINNNSFVSGVVRNNQRVRARYTTLLEIPVNLNYLEILNTFTSLKGRRQIDYKAALAVKFSIPILGDMVWNFEHSGDVPIPQAPRLTLPSMGVERVDLNGVTLAVSVNVENPNSFELPSPKVAYDYLVSGSSFIKSTVDTRPLAASSVTPVTFRFSVSYADLFRSITSLPSSGSVPSLLNLSFDFGVPAFSGDIFNLQIPGSLPLTGR